MKNLKVTGASMLVIATGLNSVFGFLYNAYLGRNLVPEEFGVVALLASLIAIVNLPVGALSSTVTYRTSYLIGKHGGTARDYWRVIRRNAMKIGAIATILWLISVPFLAEIFQSQTLLPFILSAPIWLMSFLAAVDRGFLSANFSFAVLAGVVFTEALIKYILATVFIHFNQPGLVYATIPLSMVVPLVIGWMASRWAATSKRLDTSITRYFPKKFFTTIIFKDLSSVGFLSFDIILAKYYLDPEAAGYYTLISLVGKTVYFIGQLFSQFTFPIVNRAEGAQKSTLRAFMPLFIVSALFIFGGFIIFGPWGSISAPILLGERALPIIPYLTVYTFAICIFTITNLVVDYHLALRHYVFPAVGVFLSALQIIALTLFHSDLRAFIDVIVVLSVTYLVFVTLCHLFFERILIVQKNLRFFAGLLFRQTSINKSIDH